MFYEAVSAHALGITGSLETFSDIIWIQATKMVQHGDNCVYYGFIHHQMSRHAELAGIFVNLTYGITNIKN